MSGLSNYPPGVTGNEPQIAGGTDVVVEVTCGAEPFDVYPAAAVDDLLRSLADVLNGRRTVRTEVRGRWREETETEQVLRAKNRLAVALIGVAAMKFEQPEPCRFVGQVDAEVFEGTLCWECPSCGTKHEDDRFNEPDDEPDDERGMD